MLDVCCEGICIHSARTFGLAFCLETQNIHEFIKLADANLYCGKEQGRNAVINREKEASSNLLDK